jgi:hypothetical protein
VAVFCEHGNELLGSTKYEEFHDLVAVSFSRKTVLHGFQLVCLKTGGKKII